MFILIIAPFCLYATALIIYRLYLSPLAKFPGPKLAAATQYYEMYYDLISGGGGNFTREIKKMHDRYGKIVRINPSEVHIDDPEYFEEIYSLAPYSKYAYFENRFNIPSSTFSTADFYKHKPRRAALAPFFSKRKMQSNGPYIQSLVDTVCRRLKNEYVGKNKVLVLNDMYGCLTGDIITNLAFAKSYHLIETRNWESPFTIAVNNWVRTSHWMTHVKWLLPVMNLIPDGIVKIVSPVMAPIVDFRQEIDKQIKNLLDTKSSVNEDKSSATVFTDILESKLPPEELTQIRLQHEAQSVVGAGFETTKWALSVLSYHILANTEVHKRLKEELTAAIPNPDIIPGWHELQTLPYLSACVEEALRLGYGVIQRSPRVSHDHAFEYEGWVIPPGTPVSEDAFHMHHHEKIFPNSYAFKPERWLGNPKGPDGIKQLSRYMVAFGRGSRVCLGMNMAYSVIFVAAATLFRRFDLTLFETSRENVDFFQDFVTPQPKLGSLGVRVLVDG